MTITERPSSESEVLVSLYRGWVERLDAHPDMDLLTMRDMFEEWHLPTVEPTGVSYAEADAGGVPALWCIPDGCAADRVIIWTHGGGYVVGSMHSHRKVAAHLAKAAGVRALVLDYRRAPEHPHPAQVEDAIAAYRWLIGSEAIEPSHIMQVGMGFWGSKALLSAVELELFTKLGAQSGRWLSSHLEE